MIGQTKLIEGIDTLIEKGKFPRFSIICGQKGSGKKMIAKHVISELSRHAKVDYIGYFTDDIKVETIRNLISDAYNVLAPTVYVISDCDAMSPASKNSLLKITEEPPENAYFIMTVTDINNVLPTVKSRAVVFNMGVYLPTDIVEYANSKHLVNMQNVTIKEMVIDICNVPYDVDLLMKSKPLELYDYTEKVVDNIALVSGSNSFKIGDKIALSNKEDEPNKYDLALFWKLFMKICLSRFEENKWLSGIKITSKYIQDLRYQGVNKQMMFDNWILDIRNAWMELD